MSSETESTHGWLADAASAGERLHRPALTIVWSLAEPQRVGEVAWLDEGDWLVGREAAGTGALTFERGGAASGPLRASGISREQLRLRFDGEFLEVRQAGKAGLILGGARVEEGTVTSGELVTVDKQLVLLFHDREVVEHQRGERPFGHADRWGIVGESAPVLRERERLVFAGGLDAHVLLTGETGTGKELAARALHGLSRRAGAPLVTRNAPTLPEGLIDAELFGSAKNYPHAGLPERRGLIGEAEGGTLFLDEIGDLPEALQVHLLRLMDRPGEYQRLGDAKVRRADVRLIAATNRDLALLRSDLVARFALRIELCSLNERREDVPLLARHVLARLARSDPRLGQRFFEGWDGTTGEPRVAPELISSLVLHQYRQNTRELEALLMLALEESPAHFIAAGPRLHAAIKPVTPPTKPRAEPLTRAEVEAVLQRHEGNVSRSWKPLGLTSRDALNRLMRKLGIVRPG